MKERNNHISQLELVPAPSALEGYDAVPRDGPAVFIAARQRLDETGEPLGLWLRLDRPAKVVACLLRALVGDQPERWSVIDQIDLGNEMVDEQTSVAELLALAEAEQEARHD